MYDEDRPTLAECQADEYYLGPTNLPTGGIRCAHCKARHATVADIKWCRDLGDEARAEAEAEAAAEQASELAYARDREAQAERGTWFGPQTEADTWGEDD
jgi:hypothetical protein